MITQEMVDEALGNALANTDPEFFQQTALDIAIDMCDCCSDFESIAPGSIVSLVENWLERHR